MSIDNHNYKIPIDLYSCTHYYKEYSVKLIRFLSTTFASFEKNVTFGNYLKHTAGVSYLSR